MSEIICFLIAFGAALLIAAGSIFIAIKRKEYGMDFTWEDFWKGRIKKPVKQQPNSEIEKWFDQIEQKQNFRQKIMHYVFGGTFATLLITAIVYVIMRLATGTTTKSGNTVSSSAINELPVICALAFLGAVFVFTLVWYVSKKIKMRNIVKKLQKIPQDQIADTEGYVYRRELIAEKQSKISAAYEVWATANGKKVKKLAGKYVEKVLLDVFEYQLWIAVKELDTKLLRTIIRVPRSSISNNFVRYDKVFIKYDKNKPNWCVIAEEEEKIAAKSKRAKTKQTIL